MFRRSFLTFVSALPLALLGRRAPAQDFPRPMPGPGSTFKTRTAAPTAGGRCFGGSASAEHGTITISPGRTRHTDVTDVYVLYRRVLLQHRWFEDAPMFQITGPPIALVRFVPPADLPLPAKASTLQIRLKAGPNHFSAVLQLRNARAIKTRVEGEAAYLQCEDADAKLFENLTFEEIEQAIAR